MTLGSSPWRDADWLPLPGWICGRIAGRRARECKDPWQGNVRNGRYQDLRKFAAQLAAWLWIKSS
jgi:hypothetical protein